MNLKKFVGLPIVFAVYLLSLSSTQSRTANQNIEIFSGNHLSGDTLDAKQNTANSASAINVAYFTGAWRGSERCMGISEPVTVISIKPKSVDEVYVSGIYNTQGKVIGNVEGSTIVITRQAVPNQMFMKVTIEGKLTLSKDKRSLTGSFMVVSNEMPDQCAAVYEK